MAKQRPRLKEKKKWQATFDNMLNSLMVSVLLFDMEFNCLAVNESVYRLTGITSKEWANTDIRDRYSPEEYKELYKIDQEAMRKAFEAGSNIFQYEYFIHHASGEKIPVIISQSFNYNSEGHPESTWVTLTDIREIKQERKKREEKEKELIRVKREMKHLKMRSEMIITSRAMQNVFDLIIRCSKVDSNVLILGETGVGKDMAARAIHEQSPRGDKPFVAVNCAALPDPLLESELFGHVKGAFTGALSNHLGLFREAHGGTLFLDEIGDL
ncbi:MAG: sigma 54-interacting transcriptional regulator, partial [Deltaproteobacteria bacterium]|nr:sigma 54-interacting transcriptional regulator [Deltaproteobacteria bacterium]